MSDAQQVLDDAAVVIVVDWPTKDVPDSLARAGLEVHVSGGPEPDNWSLQEVVGAEVVGRRTGAPPAHADVVWSFRPLDELEEVISLAASTGATTVWLHSGRAPGGAREASGCWFSDADREMARRRVEDAGLQYVDSPYVVDVARARAR